jgi:hypothetical protein
MPVSRPLFYCCEALAALALMLWFVFPPNVDIAIRVSSDTHVGISLRQLAPLLLRATAGVLSIVALTKVALGIMLHS